ncbi:SDR family oxidoreductase [Larkinella soli]|uniref:SDR family oxidoreductase n=1 Tax=Larkinella soli TaxID=1770527 RepID=UPI000FFBD416|nr:NAD(P)H-binding protein [Larkinella soli]
MKTVFITGGTGYLGRRLIRGLLSRGHRVCALVRPGSESKVPDGAEVISGNPFDAGDFADRIPFGCVFVQLLGVPHPSPAKAAEFRRIDLVSVQESVKAAGRAGVSHFIYVSVSTEPTRVMKAYQEVRQAGERAALEAGLNSTFLRPWYILGPGHWWPVLLLPLYALAELTPSVRQKARALSPVLLPQMLASLIESVEAAPKPLRILEIPDIRTTKPDPVGPPSYHFPG